MNVSNTSDPFESGNLRPTVSKVSPVQDQTADTHRETAEHQVVAAAPSPGTPNRNSLMGTILSGFDSIGRVAGFRLFGRDAPPAQAPPTNHQQPQTQRVADNDQDLEQTHHDEEHDSEDSQHDSQPSPPLLTPAQERFIESIREKKALGKRRSLLRERATSEDAGDAKGFEPVQAAGTNKRKLGNEDLGRIDEPTRDDNTPPSTPLAKTKQTSAPVFTPRSAMKSRTAPRRMGLNAQARFNDHPVSGVKTIPRIIYGNEPSGNYKGTMFLEPGEEAALSPSGHTGSSMSDLDPSDVISPNTRGITAANTPIRDPQNPDWRPSLGNPRPGQFVVPYVDDESDPSDLFHVEEIPSQPPTTPRPSHAELPVAQPSGDFSPDDSSLTTLGSTNSLPSDNSLLMSTELQLEKQRSAAKKHSSKRPSGLSSSVSARSRSSSPPASGTILPDSTEIAPRPTRNVPYVDTKSHGRIYEDDLVYEDGKWMTWKEAEFYWDDYYKNIFDKVPVQTYAESGVSSQYISDLVEKNMTPEDHQRANEFWVKEFEETEKAQNAAKASGKTLRLVFNDKGDYI